MLTHFFDHIMCKWSIARGREVQAIQKIWRQDSEDLRVRLASWLTFSWQLLNKGLSQIFSPIQNIGNMIYWVLTEIWTHLELTDNMNMTVYSWTLTCQFDNCTSINKDAKDIVFFLSIIVCSSFEDHWKKDPVLCFVGSSTDRNETHFWGALVSSPDLGFGSGTEIIGYYRTGICYFDGPKCVFCW